MGGNDITATTDGPDAAHWRGMVERRERQMDAAYAALGRTSADYWARRIGNRPSLLRRIADDDDPTIRTMLPYLSQTATVVDVGAGAGRYALAIAPRAASVVAVEPDAAMVPRLEEALSESGTRNVEVVEARWQDAEVEAADLVLCAHVLYPIADAASFIHKLDACARRACFLALREIVSEPEPLGRLWYRFHGERRCLQPGYVEAFNLMHELGIRANVSVGRIAGPSWSWEDLDGAVAGVREHLILPESPEIDAVIRMELTSAVIEDGGMLSLRVDETYMGVLWWEK